MITKILIGIIATLLAAFYWTNARLETAQEGNALLGRANEVLAVSVGRLDQQRQKSVQASESRLQELHKAESARQRYERDLMIARQQNEALVKHLGSYVPGDIINGLLRRADQGSACVEGDTEPAVPGADTCSSTVSFERLYSWTGNLVDSLGSCNADKAAARMEVTE